MRCLKRILIFFLSNFGSLILLACYITLGMFLFKYVEQPIEIRRCQTGATRERALIKKYSQDLFNYIYYRVQINSSVNDNYLYKKETDSSRDSIQVYNGRSTKMLKDLRNSFIEIGEKYRYTGKDCEENSLWNLQSSLLFTVSILTTIGYGHVVPRTGDGQIICMCYATLGIPLFLISVARIGKIFSKLLSRASIYIISAITATEKIYVDIDTKMRRKSKFTEQESEIYVVPLIKNPEKSKNQPEMSKDQPEKSHRKTNKEYILIVTSLIIVIGYITIGAFIFKCTEGWSFLSAFYFSFVTVSSIGFGDFVPNMNAAATEAATKTNVFNIRIVIAIVYMIIGIAILAIGFNLITQGMKATFKIILNKMNKFDDKAEI